MLTFVGRGYTPAFAGGMEAVIARLSGGEPIEIVDGPDAICAAICDEPGAHCRLDRVKGRDEAAATAMHRLLDVAVRPGAVLDLPPDRLATMRAAFAAGESRVACLDCEWEALCTAIAADGFAGTHLTRPPEPNPCPT